MNVRVDDGDPRQGKARRGRPRRSDTGLSRERILDVAAGLINSQGTEKLTMRRISVELGVDPMSLYNYFGNKDELLDGVALRFLDALPRPEPSGDLAADVREFSAGFRRSAAAEPQVAVLLLTRQLGSMSGLGLTDSVLRGLQCAGFDPDGAVRAFRLVFAFLVGTVLRESSIGPSFAGQDLGGLLERRGELESAGLQHVAESAEALAVLDHDREFEFGLEVLVGGLERQLEAETGERSSRK